MLGKILIVDDVATNRIVLKVKLAAAFYKVLQASDPDEAVELVSQERPDVVLVADRVGGRDGAGLCQRIRDDPATAATALVTMVPEGNAAARHAALRAGADDVIDCPVDAQLLLARLRKLMRSRDLSEELNLRLGTERLLGLTEPPPEEGQPARIAMVGPEKAALVQWKAALAAHSGAVMHVIGQDDMMERLGQDPAPDAVLLALAPDAPDAGLRLLAEMRSRSDTRHAAIVAALTAPDRNLEETALDLGANDVIGAGFEPEEVALRLDAQLRRKRHADRLRADLREGMRAALIDPLTGLYNRRYALPHLARIGDAAVRNRCSFAVMVLDLDHFKRVNDSHGHSAGDAVLVEVARRLRDNLRAGDLIARIGGEEFLVVLPETGAALARATAARLCERIAARPVALPGQRGALRVTLSIGLAVWDAERDMASAQHGLVEAADRALYGAKNHGRNRVSVSPARPAA